MEQQQLRATIHAFLQNYPLEDNFQIQSFVQTLRYNNAANQLYSDEIYQVHADGLLHALLLESLCHPAQLDILLKCLFKMENDGSNRYAFRLAAAAFLSEQLQPRCALLAWALSFLRNNCCSFLHDAPAISMRDAIFARCLKLWHTEGFSDLVVHRLLLHFLQELRAPSSVWLSELRSSSRMHYQSCLAECDRLLEEQLQCPSLAALRAQAFAEAIPPDVVAKSVSIQIRIALCSALRPVETTPLLKHLEDLKLVVPNNSFQLSHDWKQAIKHCPARIRLMVEQEIDNIVDQFFADFERPALLWPDNDILTQVAEEHWLVDHHPEDVTGLLDECRRLLGAAHPRFTVQITLFITSLMQAFLQFHQKQSITWEECCSLCYSAWTHAFATWLDRAMFETSPAAKSDQIKALARLVLCMVVWIELSPDLGDRHDLAEEIGKLWRDYRDQRTLFMESFGDKQDQLRSDVEIVKTLLFSVLQ